MSFTDRVRNTLGQRSLPTPERKDDTVERAVAGVPYVNWGQPQWQQRTWDLHRTVSEGYERVIWLWRGIDAIADTVSGLTIRAVKGDVTDPRSREFVDDPILRNLNLKASPFERARYFRYRLSSLLILSKSGVHVEVVRTNAGKIHSLSLIDPTKIEVIPDDEKLIGGWRISMPDGGYTHLPNFDVDDPQPKSVLWVRKPHPTDPFSGTTPLEAAGISIDLDFWARLYNRTFMINDGRPGGLLAIRGRMAPEDTDEIRSRFGSGVSNAGRTTVIQADDINWVDTAISPRDAQYVESRSITKEEILLAIGTPESVIGNASGRTFDNADAEYEIWLERTVVPHKQIIEHAFEELTAGGLEDDVNLWHDTSHIWVLDRAHRAREDRAQTEFDKGLITVDEYREITGRDPYDRPNSRVGWLASGKFPVGQADDEAAASDSKPVGQADKAPAGGASEPSPPAGLPSGVELGTQRGALAAVKSETKSDDGDADEGVPDFSDHAMVATDVTFTQATIDAIDELEGIDGLHLTDPESWHVTLAYLGRVGPDEKLPEVLDVVDGSAWAPLPGQLNGPAVFGGRGEKRALVLLLDVPGLSAYRAQLADELAECGRPADPKHDFTAHVTVAYLDPDISPRSLSRALLVLDTAAHEQVLVDHVLVHAGEQETQVKDARLVPWARGGRLWQGRPGRPSVPLPSVGDGPSDGGSRGDGPSEAVGYFLTPNQQERLRQQDPELHRTGTLAQLVAHFHEHGPERAAAYLERQHAAGAVPNPPARQRVGSTDIPEERLPAGVGTRVGDLVVAPDGSVHSINRWDGMNDTLDTSAPIHQEASVPEAIAWARGHQQDRPVNDAALARIRPQMEITDTGARSRGGPALGMEQEHEFVPLRQEPHTVPKDPAGHDPAAKPRLTASTLREGGRRYTLPEAEAFARGIYDRVDLGHDYYTEVQGVSHEEDSDHLVVNGAIIAPDGQQVGAFTRAVYVSPEGTGYVKNMTFAMEPGFKQQGLGTAFIKATHERAARQGLMFAEVEAAGDGQTWNGGYTWARLGYDWYDGFTPPGIKPVAMAQQLGIRRALKDGTGNHELTAQTREETLAKARAMDTEDYGSMRTGFITPWLHSDATYLEWQALLERMGTDDEPTPYEWSELGRADAMSGTWLGKELMVRSSWDGAMPLYPPPEKLTENQRTDLGGKPAHTRMIEQVPPTWWKDLLREPPRRVDNGWDIGGSRGWSNVRIVVTDDGGWEKVRV